MTLELEDRLRQCFVERADGVDVAASFDAEVARRVVRLRRRAARRRVAMVGAVAAVTVLVVGTVAMIRNEDRARVISPVPTTIGSIPETTIPGRVPGSWRSIEPSPLTPTTVLSAVWTGEEILMVGIDERQPARECQVGGCSEHDPYAVGYRPRSDEWRRLADLPVEAGGAWGLPPHPQAIWNGREMLVVTIDEGVGTVLAYAAAVDAWSVRTLPVEGVRGAATSDDGALLWSDNDEWWWLDAASGRWDQVGAPPIDEGDAIEVVGGSGPVVVAGLAPPTVSDRSISFTAFDPSTAGWSIPAEVDIDAELDAILELQRFDWVPPDALSSPAPDFAGRAVGPVVGSLQRVGGIVVAFGGSVACSMDTDAVGVSWGCSYGPVSSVPTTVPGTGGETHAAEGLVIDPLTGTSQPLARDLTLFTATGLRILVGVPWIGVDDQIFDPVTGALEPLTVDAPSFGVWTGTELVFVGGGSDQRSVGAYTPEMIP